MDRSIFIVSILTLILGCSSPVKKETPEALASEYFPGVSGCFLLYNLKTAHFDKVIGDERCLERFPACSTFKVPLAAIAFDSGVLKDENVVFKWDGKKDPRPEVNQDHNAKTWMSNSVVWYSQRITAKLGTKKLQHYLNELNYGNKDISYGTNEAWLVEPSEIGKGLRISAHEQVDFMKKLWTDALPVSKRAMKLTRELTYLETSPKGFKLNGKTGSNYYSGNPKLRLGWFISHLQNGDQEYIAVANFSDREPTKDAGYGGMKAKAITKRILADLGLW